MPSDAKKKRDAKKKEVAKKHTQQPKKNKEETNGVAENGTQSEANGRASVSEVHRGEDFIVT